MISRRLQVVNEGEPRQRLGCPEITAPADTRILDRFWESPCHVMSTIAINLPVSGQSEILVELIFNKLRSILSGYDDDAIEEAPLCPAGAAAAL